MSWGEALEGAWADPLALGFSREAQDTLAMGLPPVK